MASKKSANTQSGTTPLLEKQPQSKQAAAQSAGVYLSTDSKWSDDYWNSNSLHCRERELFG